MSTDWPFADAEETEVITLARIVRGESAIRLVTHDEEDGAWQFLDGEHVFEADAVLLALAEMIQLDPSLLALDDLPLGWYAWRDDPSAPWRRATGEPPADLGVDSSA